MNSEWSEEVLFPSANAVAYRLIFEAETWLRRICWAALLLSEGPAWAASLDNRMRRSLEQQSKSNSSRWYLGVDAEEELLWSTTQGQLANLLRMESIQNKLRHICGLNGELLSQRLQSMSQVRNVLAHNRAISEDSLTVLRGDLIVIRAAAKRFKSRTLYAQTDIVSLDDDDLPDDLYEVLAAFAELEETVWKRDGQQVFVAANRDFIQLIRLPVQVDDAWVDGRKLRTALGIVSHLILCVLANKDMPEIAIVLPRNLPPEDQVEVVKRFMTPAFLQGVWTDTPPESQSPASSGWARLWFYENRTPVDE
jgi:hypothetical protein